MDMIIKNVKYKDQECYHEYTKAKGDSLIFKMFIL